MADTLSVHSAGSSSSDVEEISMSFVPESPDGQEKKVTAPFFLTALRSPSFPGSPLHTHKGGPGAPAPKQNP